MHPIQSPTEPSHDDLSIAASSRPGRDGIRTGDAVRVGVAAAGFFLLLCSYYILRPVRDEMGVQHGVERLQWLFTGTFLSTLAIVPIFGWVVRRVPRPYLVPVVYGFLVVILVGFAAVFRSGITPTSAAAFFIWLSVVNLFIVSLFWSRVSDTFSTQEAHRFYGYIAAGGTAGALTGPATTALLAERVETASLLVISAILLAGAGACLVALGRYGTAAEPANTRPIGGSILAGIPLTLRLANLRGVALLVICYTAISTVLYVELVGMVGRILSDPGERTSLFATLDLGVNVVALAIQLLGTRWMVERFGLRAALTVVPAVVIVGLGALGAWQTVVVLALVQTLHRAGEFALVRPGREMIYTTVGPESRYKAKNFIDTTVYRGNDAASAWLVALVRAAGLNAILLVGLPAGAAWLATGWRLGTNHDRNEPA